MKRDVQERQDAFTGLLATPVIGRVTHPQLWPLVRRHRPILVEWFSDRLGYRLVVAEESVRLYRLPLDGVVVSPARIGNPSRRILVLALLVAASAEDADDLTTVQELSDRVSALAARDDVRISGYNPDRFGERQLFIRAVDLLTQLGVLRPTARAGEEMLSGWAHQVDPIGGAYHVQRELLLRLVDPVGVAAAVGRRSAEMQPDDRYRRYTIMRRLLETPVCLVEDLTEPERAYLSSQRHRLLAWCREMTGWAAEQRTEGIALIPYDEAGTDRPFPKLRADHFGALLVLGRLSGVITMNDVRAAATDVAALHPKAMTVDFRKEPAQLATAAVTILAELDLLRSEDAGWRVMPVAARYRNPKVTAVQQRLEGE